MRIMSRLNVIQEGDTAPKTPKILAVAAGKGGVGKSTVAVNLALALQKRGIKVGLLDADVYGPSLEQMLPKGMEPVENLENPERLHPGLSFGMPFISVAHFRKEAAIVRAPIANQIIEQFLEVVDWGDLDYLIADFPPGTGDIQLTLMQKAPIAAALMVTTPQFVATLDVRKAIQLFQRMEIPVLGVVENMSFFSHNGERMTPFGVGGGALLAEEFGLPLLGEVPIDEQISQAGDRGLSLLEEAPSSSGAIAFKEIASSVIEKLEGIQVPEIEVREGDSQHIQVGLEGRWHLLPLQTLQKHCPCARCIDEKKSREDVSLLEFSPVGRYAIRVTFSSGCSQGIYPLSLLERLISV